MLARKRAKIFLRLPRYDKIGDWTNTIMGVREHHSLAKSNSICREHFSVTAAHLEECFSLWYPPFSPGATPCPACGTTQSALRMFLSDFLCTETFWTHSPWVGDKSHLLLAPGPPGAVAPPPGARDVSSDIQVWSSLSLRPQTSEGIVDSKHWLCSHLKENLKYYFLIIIKKALEKFLPNTSKSLEYFLVLPIHPFSQCLVSLCINQAICVVPGSLPRILQGSSDQSLSRVQLFATPWTAARQASLSTTNSQNLLKLMSIESVMPSDHLILCRPPLLRPSIFPRIKVFSNESVLPIRWSNHWSFSFSISPSKKYSGLISFRMDWLDLLAVQGALKSLLQNLRVLTLSVISFLTWMLFLSFFSFPDFSKYSSMRQIPLSKVFKICSTFPLGTTLLSFSVTLSAMLSYTSRLRTFILTFKIGLGMLFLLWFSYISVFFELECIIRTMHN